MKEKEMKKLDEKSEEKISGGTKPLEELIDPEKVALMYGGPKIRPFRPSITEIKLDKFYDKNKTKEGEKPEDALVPAPAPSEPKTEEKK